MPRGTAPLVSPEVDALLRELHPDWRVSSGPRLERVFHSREFAALGRLVAAIAALADELDHHPEVELAWGRLAIGISTHSIGGLSMNDFVLAARIDDLALAAGFGAGAGH